MTPTEPTRSSAEPASSFAALPDPSQARTLDELVHQLRLLKIWAGDPSYETIKDRINAAQADPRRPAGERARKNTVADCFKIGRRRINADLVVAVVGALHPNAGYAAQWRQVLRIVLGETRAAGQVRARDTLPDGLAGFTGRAAELERLRRLANATTAADSPAVVATIEGMAGVGKTQLAVHAGHLLHADRPFDRVLFVDLRGFHPDPAQPPADPGAVLDSFLRLLGVPGQQIPHPLPARRAAYRERLAGRRVLVVLDNAAGEEQVRPLLPDLPGSLTLVTSRRRLTGLRPAVHLPVDVFSHAEAVDLLGRAAPGVAPGEDPDAPDRVARRCGCLPLAIGVIAAHMRGKPDWTMTDHADWLDQRHRAHRLDSDVELALSLSYQGLPPGRQRLFRLLAVHPGADIDPYAAAALAAVEPAAARDDLRRLVAEHLLQPAAGSDRFSFHDLVRAYAADRAGDEDRPAARRAALTRLLDHYLSTAAAAMDTAIPEERHRRPDVPRPTRPDAGPALDDAGSAYAWLDAERLNLIAAIGHSAGNGWPGHTIGLAATLFRYLEKRGEHSNALTVHAHARSAAQRTGDRAAEAHALTDLGIVTRLLGNYQEALDLLQQAVALADAAGHRPGLTRALANLGLVHRRLGRMPEAIEQYERARDVSREIGDRFGEAHALSFLGVVHEMSGLFPQAAEHHRQAVILCREIGDRMGEAYALGNLGYVYLRLARYPEAVDHLGQTLAISLELGDRFGEGHALTALGMTHAALGRYAEAIEYHLRGLAVFQEVEDPGGEVEARNGLGDALRATGRPEPARDEYTAALALATELGERYEQARSHDGLAHIHHATGDLDRARTHWREALAGFDELGSPEVEQVRAALSALDRPAPGTATVSGPCRAGKPGTESGDVVLKG